MGLISLDVIYQLLKMYWTINLTAQTQKYQFAIQITTKIASIMSVQQPILKFTMISNLQIYKKY